MRTLLGFDFFNYEAAFIAKKLLGKVLRHRYKNHWLSIRIIETEAYYMSEKASHASLGYTLARRALFAPPGTIYMYYARGGDSFNFSCKGKGNAVIIKSAIPYFDRYSHRSQCLPIMQGLNPLKDRFRPPERLCSGQTLLCKSLGLKVPDWNNHCLQRGRLQLEDVGIFVEEIIRCRRLGIPKGRDEHLMLRFIDKSLADCCTQNPLTKRKWQKGRDYHLEKFKQDQYK